MLKQMVGDTKRLQQRQRMLWEKIDAVRCSWPVIEWKGIERHGTVEFYR